MKPMPRIITDNNTLYSQYDTLQAGDIIAVRMRLKVGEEHLLLDLEQRGIKIIPSATAQLASRSKAYQARIFSQYMPPCTTVIYSANDLLTTILQYQQEAIGQVVLKQDRKNGGLGIHLFSSIEEVFNLTISNSQIYPFVLQPYLPECRDIRAIFLGDYMEAYERDNPNSFRNNLHCGGLARPHTLSPQQKSFCRSVMTRGSFPYAHIDLIIDKQGKHWLSEINLRGGLRGAQIKGAAYQKTVSSIHQHLITTQQT